MIPMDQDRVNDKLNPLWAQYREACPDPEPTAGFMPQMWQRIEARRQCHAFVLVPHMGRSLAGGYGNGRYFNGCNPDPAAPERAGLSSKLCRRVGGGRFRQ